MKPIRTGKHKDGKLTANEHYRRNLKKFGTKKIEVSGKDNKEKVVEIPKKPPFGLGVNKLKTVLVVPELRKRRSKRDMSILKEQLETCGVV